MDGPDVWVTVVEWAIPIALGLCLLLRLVNSGGTMRRKDVERNTRAMLAQGQRRKAARDLPRVLDELIRDSKARTQGNNYRKEHTR